MRLEIISPEKSLFEGDVDSVVLPGTMGSFEVLENHAPIISSLEEGQIKVMAGQDSQSFDIKSGFVEVLKNKVIVLV